MDTQFYTALQPCCLKSHQHLQFPLRGVSHFFYENPSSATKVFTLKAITRTHNCSLEGSREEAASKPFKAWLWSDNETKRVFTPDNLDKSLFEDVTEKAKSVPLLLYRALLVVGIGLGTTAPATAGAPPPSSEVLVQETVEKATHKTAEKNAMHRGTAERAENTSVDNTPQADAENKVGVSLGEEFWNKMDLSKGSILTILKSILEGDPNNRDALECLAKTLVDMDDALHALIVIEKLERLEPAEMEWKYLKAFAYDMSNKFPEAKQIYEEILKVEPFSSKALQGLMMAMDELDETDAMAEIVAKTITLARAQDNVTEARNIAMLIGQFYMMKGHLRDALEHYNEMLEEDAKDFRPHLCQGIIYSALGEKAKAEQKFKAYEKLCPKDYPERKYLDALMRKAKQEGQKRFEEKQKEKYVRIPKDEKKIPLDE